MWRQLTCCALMEIRRHAKSARAERMVWDVQIEQLNAKVQELQTKSWQDSNCRSELDLLKST